MTPLSVVAFALALLGVSPSPTANPRTPVGQPYDISLSASTEFAHPMRDVDMTGVFSGPAGQQLVLPGFRDGGRTFGPGSPRRSSASLLPERQ
jgi:Domain of unknown function (DUF5060)